MTILYTYSFMNLLILLHMVAIKDYVRQNVKHAAWQHSPDVRGPLGLETYVNAYTMKGN